MSKITCLNLACKYCDNDNVCSCDEVNLTFHCIQTKFNGQQKFLQCQNYEETEDEAYQSLKKYLEGRF